MRPVNPDHFVLYLLSNAKCLIGYHYYQQLKRGEKYEVLLICADILLFEMHILNMINNNKTVNFDKEWTEREICAVAEDYQNNKLV